MEVSIKQTNNTKIAKDLRSGQVIKGVGGLYDVLLQDGSIVNCTGRGKLRVLGDIYIGDYVEISVYKAGKGAIERIFPRKNKLTRPYVTNIDAIVICIAPIPRPDFLLVDKLLINCIIQDIKPIICVNKTDIMDEKFRKNVDNSYNDIADIAYVSSLTGEGIDEFSGMIKDHFVSLAGQSAVGKSSIVNAIVGRQMLEVGELSRKVERGRHTTRTVEIFDIGHGIRLADTCGFSVLELVDFDPAELSGYFTDFDNFRADCKFRGCCHYNEPDCGVKNAVDKGLLSAERYERYITLYKDLLDKWRKRYD